MQRRPQPIRYAAIAVALMLAVPFLVSAVTPPPMHLQKEVSGNTVILSWAVPVNPLDGFTDPFDGPDLDPRWEALTGTWEVHPNGYAIGTLPQNGDDEGFVLRDDDTDLANFYGESSVRVVHGDKFWYAHFGTVGLELGDENENYGYYIYANVHDDKISIIRSHGGQDASIKHVSNANLNQGTEWNTVAMAMDDGFGQVYLNGVCFHSWQDQSPQQGKHGVAGEDDNDTYARINIAQTAYWGEPTPSGDAPADLIEYVIYRNGEEVGTTTDLTYTDATPPVGTNQYEVTARYPEGESYVSNPVFFTTSGSQEILFERFDSGLPASWTVEGNTTTMTWAVEVNIPFESLGMVMSIPEWATMLNYNENLISPLMDLSTTTRPVLGYDSVVEDGVIGTRDNRVEVRAGDGDWMTVASHNALAPNARHYVEALSVAEETDVQVRFVTERAAGAAGWGDWGIDNVAMLAVDTPGLHLFCLDPSIDPDGEVIRYDVNLYGDNPDLVPGLSYWITITLPNGNEIGPFAMQNFNAPPNINAWATGLTVAIPGSAALGQYILTGHVGHYPNSAFSDAVVLAKPYGLAPTPGGGENLVWGGDSSPVAAFDAPASSPATDGTLTPASFELAAPYPNPFNPTAQVAVNLPDAGELTVTVTNTLGQQVAVLASGQHSAGTHRLTIDGSSWASGLYFVQAHMAGQPLQTRKLMLLR